MPVTSRRSPGYPQFLSDVAMNQRLHDLLLGLGHLLEQLTEARVTLTYVYFNSVNIELSLLFICFLLGNNPLLIKLKLPLYA